MQSLQRMSGEETYGTKMIKLLQANLNRSNVANSLLAQLVRERNVDVVMVSEQYQNSQRPTWYSDILGTAAIWISNSARIRTENHGVGRGYVWIKHAGIHFVSCYFTPNEPIRQFEEKLASLEDAVRNWDGSVVLAGDFNARALEWGMAESDRRGELLTEMAARLGLVTLNVGDTPTFRRPGYGGTIPDVSFASEDIAGRVEGWEVIEDYTGSDHQYIAFSVRGERENGQVPPRPRRWNVKKLDEEAVTRVCSNGLQTIVVPTGDETREEVENIVSATMDLMRRACERSMPRTRPRRDKQPVYWWSEEIAEMRRNCLRLRRRAQRARDRAEANQLSAEHRDAKRLLRRTINRSKVSCWKRLTEEVNSDPWGLAYKIVTRKLESTAPPVCMGEQRMAHVVNALFPTHPLREEAPIVDEGMDIPPFTEEELRTAVTSLRNGKAPGPDGIPAEVLKVVARDCPELLLRMFNASLRAGVFSSRWKTARLVLVSKGKGPADAPTSYRPLCMLDTTGKVLEKLLQPRILASIRDAGDFSEMQYGFRGGRSTVDAIQQVADAVRRAEQGNHHSRQLVLLVTLDVRNAFNSARWADMMDAMETTFELPRYLLRMVGDYLRDRSLIYETTDGQRTKTVTAGAAQGSILGPVLWNATYDSLLRMEMPEGTRLVGYADDIAALIPARTVEQAQMKMNQVMRRVTTWMEDHGLALALAKTEIVILTKKRIPTAVPMAVGEEHVETKAAAEYLGILIDSKLTYGDHIRRTADKAAKTTASLARLMANTRGPTSGKRRLLMTATQSILLYGAEVWAEAMNKECYRKRLGDVQRKGALRVACAYRTVSEPAVLVIAGVIPIALLAQERRAVYLRKAEVGKKTAGDEERRRTLDRWQTSWEQDTRGRWTARLITQVGPWIERRHGEIDYYLTQLLSGHGYFRSYLYRMGKSASMDCLYCPGVPDDAEHTFFDCDRWTPMRRSLEMDIGVFTPDNVVGVMLQTEDNWRNVAHYTQRILQAKKVDLDQA